MSFLTVTGNLGRDAELKTVNGNRVLEFSVADTVGFGDKKETQWIRCSLWAAKRAESLAPYMKKGAVVEVCGTPKINTYKTQAGEFRAGIDVNVLDVRLHGGGKAERQEAPADEFEQDSVPF
jgi:single-strand DNA-binding protein